MDLKKIIATTVFVGGVLASVYTGIDYFSNKQSDSKYIDFLSSLTTTIVSGSALAIRKESRNYDPGERS